MFAKDKKDETISITDALDFESISNFEREIKPYGNFKLKIPSPREVKLHNIDFATEITRQVIRKYGEDDFFKPFFDKGQTDAIVSLIGSAMPESERMFVKNHLLLDYAIVEKPESLKQKSFQDCYDRELIDTLWNWYIECENQFYENIKKKKEGLSTL